MELFEGSLRDLLPPDCPANPVRPCRTGSSRNDAVRSPNAEKAFAKAVSLPKRLRRQGCACGACQTCLENARWERIFNEKFADHSYYRNRGPQFSSPLSEAGGG
jgi:hypothetical protein